MRSRGEQHCHGVDVRWQGRPHALILPKAVRTVHPLVLAPLMVDTLVLLERLRQGPRDNFHGHPTRRVRAGCMRVREYAGEGHLVVDEDTAEVSTHFRAAALHVLQPGVARLLRLEQRADLLVANRVVDNELVAYLQPLRPGNVERHTLPRRPHLACDSDCV